jgi:hypothetical protein
MIHANPSPRIPAGAGQMRGRQAPESRLSAWSAALRPVDAGSDS